MANKPDKVMEYGEKTIAADPNNLLAYNLLAYDYSIGRTNPDKAVDYAKKAIELASADEEARGRFPMLSSKRSRTTSSAWLTFRWDTLHYYACGAAKSKKLTPAIEELKTAADLLGANPELQGQALYYLAYAYESGTPVNHKGAMEALNKAASLQSSWKAQADDLLAKVKKAASRGRRSEPCAAGGPPQQVRPPLSGASKPGRRESPAPQCRYRCQPQPASREACSG